MAGLFLGPSRVASGPDAIRRRFCRQVPQVTLQPEVLYVDDGDVLTSAGTAAGIDCCLHLLRVRHGAEAANRAARALMSRRTFTRRFREATGTTVGQWLQNQRLALAQRLLETTERPVERVASDAGFGSAVSLRKHFTAAFRVSPASYRRQFSQQGAQG